MMKDFQHRHENLIIRTDKILTKTVYLVYPLFLIVLFLRKDPGLTAAVLVPGISFIVVSIFRALLNAPRPYDHGGPKPIINRKGSGKSFPSRHAFSVFVIATTVFWFYPLPGIIVGIAGFVLVTARVLGGVHYPRDVLCGALIGIACGVIVLWITS